MEMGTSSLHFKILKRASDKLRSFFICTEIIFSYMNRFIVGKPTGNVLILMFPYIFLWINVQK